MGRWISGLGIPAFLLLAWMLSTDRRAVRWRPVAWGVALQLIFAVLILKTVPGRWVFQTLNRAVVALLDYQYEGARFVFHTLAIPPEQPGSLGFFFAFQVLTTIIFFSSLISILYHLGVMQRVVLFMARIMVRTCGTSGAETLSAAANVFVGPTEAPLLIRPYVGALTRSELMCVMTGGMATIAGGVMAAYVGMLRARIPDIAGHLLAASVMSAPAALAISKLLLPETERPATAGRVAIDDRPSSANVIDAAAEGALTGLRLAANVGAILIAFMSLLALANGLLGAVGGRIGLPDLRLEWLLGWAFAPLAWLMGIPASECWQAGQLLGQKTILNEFVAYSRFAAEMAANPSWVSPRAAVILSYALCGFSNLMSVGILLGGLGALAPERRGDLVRLGLRAVVGGSLACFITAAIAGLLI